MFFPYFFCFLKEQKNMAEGQRLTVLPVYSLFFGFLAAQTANEKVDNTLRSTNGLTPMGPSLIQIAYISSVFGLSLAVNVFIWYRVSGGMFNPAVSIRYLTL